MTVDLRAECRKLVDEWPEDDLLRLLDILKAEPTTLHLSAERPANGAYSIVPETDDYPTWTYLPLSDEIIAKIRQNLNWSKQLNNWPDWQLVNIQPTDNDDLPDGAWPESSDSE